MKLAKVLFPGACVVVGACLAVAAMDLAFRWYEARHLIHNLEDLPGPFNLQELGYHHHGQPVSRNKTAETFRILSLGDSFAHSVTTPENTYAAMLEMALNEAAASRSQGARSVEVINLGVPSVSFPEYLKQGRHWSPLLEHDAVVLNIYAGNDFHETGDVPPKAAVRERLNVQVGLGTHIPRTHLLRFMDYLAAFMKSGTIQPPKVMDAPSDYDPVLTGEMDAETYRMVMLLAARRYVPALDEEFQPSLAWCREAMRFLAEEARQGRVVRILVSPPHFWHDPRWLAEVQRAPEFAGQQLDPDLPAALVRQLAAAEGLDPGVVLDLQSPLQQRAAAGETLYLGTNSHWTVAGNAVAADVLERAFTPVLAAWPGSAARSPSQQDLAVAVRAVQ